jgi:LysM repeat protein
LVHHTVKPGDTLYSIANEYGVSASDIQKANNMTGTSIVPGQTLVIPTAGGATPPPGPAAFPTAHKVKEGETLFSIAQRYGVSVNEIKNANNITGTTIAPGQTLTIPAAGGAVTPSPPPS